MEWTSPGLHGTTWQRPREGKTDLWDVRRHPKPGRRLQPWSRVTKISSVLSSHLISYCDYTSLHGMRYITTKNSHWCERLLWLVLCLLGVITAILLIQVIWSRFQGSPTVTTVQTVTYPISNVPFPAVTICNVNKVYQPAAKALAQNLTDQGLNETLVLKFLHQLSNLVKPTTTTNTSYLTLVEDHLATMGINIITLMKQMTQPCNKLIIRCHWRGHVQDCNTFFRLMLSIEGFCCAFNYNALASHLDETKKEDFKTEFANGAGSHAGLSIVLDTEPNTYFGSTQYFYGVYALIHDPDDYPDISLKKALVQPGYSLWAELDAAVIESDPGVRRLNPYLRQCWFDDEVTKLHSSVDYNYNMCITECKALEIVKQCGCLPFYYPQICALSEEHHSTNKNRTGLNCSCLNQCSDMSYSLEIHEAQLAFELFSSSDLLRGLTNRNLSLLHVYFSDTTCIKYHRMATMSWDVLLATFGGVIGLCMGGSIMSLVEVIYYFTIRLWFVIRAPAAAVSPIKTRKLHRPILMQAAQDTTTPLDIRNKFHHELYIPYRHDKRYI